jgi:UDP-2,3-diacylglucosamine pyrophosphatase LpxH
MAEKSIIAVSDVHLGMIIGNGNSDEEKYEKYRESQFRDFLDSLDFSNISDFVLLGDILDFWRHDFLNVIINESCHIDKLKELIKKYNRKTNFYYIAGNHDYHLLWLKENGADYPIHVDKSVEIRSNRKVFYLIHGHQLEVLSWSLYKPLFLYENFSEDMCLVGEEGSRLSHSLWKNYLENSSYLKPKSILEDISYKAEEILLKVRNEKAQISSKISNLDEIICNVEEVLLHCTYKRLQNPSEMSNLIKIIKLINMLEGFIEEAKKSYKHILESNSDIDLLDPPEKRMDVRDSNVKNLNNALAKLTGQWNDICSMVKENFDSNSYVSKEVCKLVIPENISFSIREIAESDARHYMFGIKKDQYLIYGHTHDAYVDENKSVANTGCWGIQDKPENRKFLYLEIIDDDVQIMSFVGKDRGPEKWEPEDP